MQQWISEGHKQKTTQRDEKQRVGTKLNILHDHLFGREIRQCYEGQLAIRLSDRQIPDFLDVDRLDGICFSFLKNNTQAASCS